jgi:thiosulfate/3-mercaptopyruvate sulfurtransferase
MTRTTKSSDALRSGAEGLTTLAAAAAKFRAQGSDGGQRLSCYCRGGMSATIDLFVLHQLGYDDLTLYDCSMGEWAKDLSLPIETD